MISENIKEITENFSDHLIEILDSIETLAQMLKYEIATHKHHCTPERFVFGFYKNNKNIATWYFYRKYCVLHASNEDVSIKIQNSKRYHGMGFEKSFLDCAERLKSIL